MSMDIRSFFTTISKKTVAPKEPEVTKKKEEKSKSKKRPKSANSSLEEIIPGTPQSEKKKLKDKGKKDVKRRRIQVVSDSSDDEIFSRDKDISKKKDHKNGTRKEVISNSESDKESKKKKNEMKKPKETKPEKPKKIVSLFEAFGNEPVKQTKVEKPIKQNAELSTHDDEDFEKTLLDLDETELLQNLEQLSGQIKENEKNKRKRKSSTSDNEKRRSLSKEREEKNKSNDSDINKKKTPTKSRKSPAKSVNSPSTSTPKSTSSRKRKTSEHDESMTDLERYEKKRYSAMLYQKYLNRSGPAHHGSKWLPKGKADCLKDESFVITGVLDSLTREEAENLIIEHGGKCMKSLSGKTKYMVVGEEAGPAKLEKAHKFGTKILSESELINLICSKSDIKNKNEQENDENNRKRENETQLKENKNSKSEDDSPDVEKSKKINLGKLKKENKTQQEIFKKENNDKTKKEVISDDDEIPEVTIRDIPKKKSSKLKEGKVSPSKKVAKKEVISDDEIPEVTIRDIPKIKPTSFYSKSKDEKPSSSTSKPKMKITPENKEQISEDQLAWVDKYKPTNIKQIIGQQTDNSNAKKLMIWLQNWYKNQNGKTKLVKPSPWAKNDNGAYFKAALLSGPPGIGKTTTANIVSKELGFDVVEFNASDTRNKKMLHEEVSQLLKTRSLAGYFTDGSAPTKNHVLLMDEVDGMSGNEDRGGMQELISLIKNTSIPIICMCNDRQHPKVRSLANYCFDLRFSKPRLEQVKGAMMSVCFKENIDISPDALNEVILGSGMDIRQILNNLSMWSKKGGKLSKETVKKEASCANKDIKIGPWEVIRKVFSEEEHKNMSIDDKYGLFFYDYSINPLFVQENYLQVKPHCSPKETLSRIAYAADSISLGDLVDAKIRSNQSWGLLDTQALYSSVIPGNVLEGHVGGQINFPGWLGKNSKTNKFKRMLSELQAHMRTSVSGNRTAVNLDYLQHIYNSLVTPLIKQGMDGIPKALAVMQEYHLMREDLTNIVELVHWPKSKDLFKNVDPKVKAAFTRAYNKEVTLPYAVTAAPVKKRRAGGGDEEELYGDEEELDEESERENDDIEHDPMIKIKKPTVKAESKATKGKESSSKGKAPNKPRAKRGK